MSRPIQSKSRALKERSSARQLRLRYSSMVIALGLACVALQGTAQAASEGDRGNGNTVEGTGALFSLTSGSYNTALGLQALYSNTTGIYNTGVGVNALYNNKGGTYNTADGL